MGLDAKEMGEVLDTSCVLTLTVADLAGALGGDAGGLLLLPQDLLVQAALGARVLAHAVLLRLHVLL